MKVKIYIFLLMLLAVCTAVWFLIGDRGGNYNVILISIDTCRADHLGCYGYPENTTPNIDSFAAESVLFKSVVAPIPFTFPSHLSMMTGTIPPYHGVHDNNGRPLSDAHITMAEVLKDNGYKTCAILASYVLAEKFGLNQGFDDYTEFDDMSVGPVAFSNGRRASETTKLSNEWLEENNDDKFFLFIHYYDPHFPYDPNVPFDTKFEIPYDGEIASVDHAIGRVLGKLKESGLYDNSLIIITSDHGEMLGQHEEEGHGYYIYEGAIKVPLIIKLPGSGKHRIVYDTVGLIDIFPTVCNYLGIEVADFIQGVDLTGYFKGKATKKDRYQYIESLTATKFGGNSLLGVVNDRWKYIQTTRPELYDIVKDPGETNNLVEEESKRADLMQGHLKQILDENVQIDDTGLTPPDIEAMKKLESLGYIGSEVDASMSFDQSKPDPKDLKHIHRLYREAMNATVMLDWENARVLCDQLLAVRSDLGLAHMLFIKIWKAGIRAEPDKAKAYEKVADMCFVLKRYDEALENWNEVLDLGVDTAELRKKVAVANVHLENSDEAIAQFNKSLQLNPAQADVNVSLGKLSLDLDKKDDALKYWTNSLKLDPNQPNLHNAIAMMYYKQGDLRAVIDHWTKAAKLQPEDAERLNNLAWLYAAGKDANIRDPQKALDHALQACMLVKYEQADYVDTLGVAYAANGQFSKAVESALKALDLAISVGDDNLVDEIRKRLELYKMNKPYYD